MPCCARPWPWKIRCLAPRSREFLWCASCFMAHGLGRRLRCRAAHDPGPGRSGVWRLAAVSFWRASCFMAHGRQLVSMPCCARPWPWKIRCLVPRSREFLWRASCFMAHGRPSASMPCCARPWPRKIRCLVPRSREFLWRASCFMAHGLGRRLRCRAAHDPGPGRSGVWRRAAVSRPSRQPKSNRRDISTASSRSGPLP